MIRSVLFSGGEPSTAASISVKPLTSTHSFTPCSCRACTSGGAGAATTTAVASSAAPVLQAAGAVQEQRQRPF
eukprot:1791862-Prymnesium_polylepis.1